MATNGGSGPVCLPPGLLGRPEFVSACRERDFGAVFALVKRYGGISQVRIAAALDMTASRVGEIIRGRRQVTSVDVVERISDRLRIPGALLGLAPRTWETVEGLRADLADVAAVIGDGDLELRPEAAVRLAHLWLTVEPPQSTELAAGRRVGHGLVRRIETRTARLRRLDDFVGGRDSFAIVTREVEITAALIRRSSHSEPVHRALLAALAELCQLAGWVQDDAGRPDVAARYYLAGAGAAEAAGDPGLGANLLSTLSYSRANNDNTEDAVLLARSAALTGAPHASPAGAALLWDRAAWAHASQGDVELCRRALAGAEEAYDRASNDASPAWAYWFDRAELDVMSGRCLTRLDRPGEAEPLLLGGIEGYDPERSRELALYRSWLAEAYARIGDVERACAEAVAVLDRAGDVNSARLDDRVVHLRRALRAYADAPQVRDLEERAEALRPSA